MKLTPRLTFIFILYAIALLAGVGVLAYSSGRKALHAATISELSATAIEKHAALNEWMAERQRDIAALAADPTIIEQTTALVGALPGSTQASAALDKLIEEVRPRIHSGEFMAIMIIDPQTGQVLAATNPGEKGQFKGDRPYFVNGKSRPFVQDVYYAPELQGPTTMASAPLRAPDGKLLSVLAAQLDLEEMNAIVNRRSGLRQTDDAFLVNRENLIVTQPYLVPDPAVLQMEVHTVAVTRCLTRTTGTVEADDYRGVPAVIAYRWMPETELCLIVKIDQAEAYAPARAFGATIFAISILALLFAVGIAVTLSQSLTRPILALQNGVARFGRGELDTKLPESSGDELGALAHEFNQMAVALADKETKLQEQAQSLEQKVQERTRELQDSYEQLARSEEIGNLGSWEWLIPENRVTWSAGLYKVFGLSPGEIPATVEGNFERVHPDDLESVTNAVSRALAAGGPFELESRFLRKDGQVRYGYTRGEVLLSPAGEPLRVVGLAIDITERKQAEENLRRFELLSKHSRDIILFMRRDNGRFLEANAAALQAYGYRREEILALTIRDLRAPNTQELTAEQMAQADAQGILFETLHRRKDGTTFPVEVSSQGANVGGVRTLVSVVRDITERKEAEENVRRSEAMLRAVLDQMPSGVTVRDARSGEILLSNTRSREILNTLVDTPAHFAQYRGFRPDGSPYRNEEWPLSRSIARGEVVRAEEINCQRSDETWITLSINTAPVRDLRGQIAMGVGVFDDITERKQAEKQLRYQAALLSNVNDAIVASDAQFRITVWNSGAESLYGWKAEEVIGRNGLEIVRTEWPEQDPAEMRRAIAQTGRWRGEATQLRKDGTRIPVEVSSIVLRDENDQITGYVSVNRDITGRKQAEEALHRLTEDLRRSNAELEQFAYVASHDLQEPLRMISSYVQLLARRYQGKLDSDADEFIDFAVDGAKRMQSLINDLLAYSRVGTRSNPFAPVSSEEILKEAMANLQFLIEESGARVTHEPLPVVKGDFTQLVTVFQNLLANAIKFRGAEPPCIHIDARQTEEEWIFSVRDNGIGIDPKFAERIFVIFQRLNERTAYPGTGIGLAICKRVIQRHSGRIWVESKLGEGATFFFTLPVKETL